MITQYSNAYIGDASISRMYQGSDLLWVSDTPDICLEYIDNGTVRTVPNVYFDSSVIPTTLTKFEVKFSHHVNTINTALFGSIDSEESVRSRCMFYMYAGTEGNIISYKYFCIDAVGKNDDAPVVDVPHTVTLYGTGTTSSLTSLNMICDGSTYSKSYSLPGMQNAQSIYLFARNKNGTADKLCAASTRIYYMKIWEDNNLIRFYIPVLHYINGQCTPCFYDKVNNTYIYNLGTDDVTYKISGDYLLDYIQNGEDSNNDVNVKYQAIDTSVNLLYDIVFRTPIIWTSDNPIMGCGSLTEKVPPDVGKTYSHQSLYQSNNSQGPRAINGVYYNTSTSSYSNCDFSTPSSYRTDDKKTFSTFINSNNKFGMLLYDSSSGVWKDTTQNFGLPDYVPTGSIMLFGLFQQSNPYPQYSRNTKGGVKIYVVNFRYLNNTPAKSYIPVLHNSQPAFLDLNSNTYIYNLGSDTPVYSFQK